MTSTTSDGTFEKDVLQAEGPVLVDFWAEWCQPCRMLAPTIDEVANDYHGRAKVGKLDTDASFRFLTREFQTAPANVAAVCPMAILLSSKKEAIPSLLHELSRRHRCSRCSSDSPSRRWEIR